MRSHCPIPLVAFAERLRAAPGAVPTCQRHDISGSGGRTHRRRAYFATFRMVLFRSLVVVTITTQRGRFLDGLACSVNTHFAAFREKFSRRDFEHRRQGGQGVDRWRNGSGGDGRYGALTHASQIGESLLRQSARTHDASQIGGEKCASVHAHRIRSAVLSCKRLQPILA